MKNADHLPRQARDKHKENSQQRRVLPYVAQQRNRWRRLSTRACRSGAVRAACCSTRPRTGSQWSGSTSRVRTSLLRCCFILKTCICQDRLGTHIGKVEKEMRFLQGMWPSGMTGPQCIWVRERDTRLFGFKSYAVSIQFEHPRGRPVFYQDRLGTHLHVYKED
jgi:hypothetical protein